MKRFVLSVRLAVALLVLMLPVSFAPASFAACSIKNGEQIKTSILPCDDGGKGIIWNLLTYVVNFLAVGVGIAAVIGITFGAVTYASAGASADQAKKGKTYITNAIIGLVFFVFLYAILNFIIPGGLL